MLVTDFGILTTVRFVQLRKALEPMLTTVSGILIFDRLELFSKAFSPISVTIYVLPSNSTFSGMVTSEFTCLRYLHSDNSDAGIAVVFSLKM